MEKKLAVNRTYANKICNYNDEELMKKWHRAKDLNRDYNNLNSSDLDGKDNILNKLLGSREEKLVITQPFYTNYGSNIYFKENCFINMNCTFLDDDIIEIGKNALIAPNTQIYTAFHHINPNKRFEEDISQNESKNNSNNLESDNLTNIDEIEKRREKGIPNLDFSNTESSPVKIGDNVWIGGGVIILPGVKIGDNSVIGAGSIVSKSIPSNKLAYGNPCKIIRDI